MPDNGMDRGVGRPGNEALREALLRWENELGGQGPDLETVRRRLAAAGRRDAASLWPGPWHGPSSGSSPGWWCRWRS